MMTRGRITTPGEMVENLGKNCRIAIPRKNLSQLYYVSRETREYVRTHIFATRLNCSSRFRGRNVIIVYLEVMT